MARHRTRRHGRPHRRYRRRPRLPGQPAEIYVATTSGGVFKSVNEGVSFTPIFDHAGGMMSIGAVAVAPSESIVVWVGTGEADNRQSSSWGDGVYKSLDGGRTWQKMGLEETRHIGKIVIHPTDPNTVYVAAVGPPLGLEPANAASSRLPTAARPGRRCCTRTRTRARSTWRWIRKDPEVVFAAMYQRQRKGWGYNGGGPGSGILSHHRWRRTLDRIDERPAARRQGPHRAGDLSGRQPHGLRDRGGRPPGGGRAVVVAAGAGRGRAGVFAAWTRRDWEHLPASIRGPATTAAFMSIRRTPTASTSWARIAASTSRTMPAAISATSSAASTAKTTCCGSIRKTPTAW